MPRRPRPEVITWEGIAYRATSYDVPFWTRANRRDGRWSIAHDGSTQYFTLDTDAAFAEKLRHEDLRTEESAHMYTTTIWQARIDQGSIVDYSTWEKADAAGFPAEALVDDDHERCQVEAQWLKGHGVGGVVSPSAALPGSLNITLFGPRVALAWGSTVRLASTIPAGRVATGRAPSGLTERVRYFGDPHPLLEEYLAEKVRARRPRRRD